MVQNPPLKSHSVCSLCKVHDPWWNGFCGLCSYLIENEGSLTKEEQEHLEKLRENTKLN